MSDLASCPHCGLPLAASSERAESSGGALGAVSYEIRRLHDLARDRTVAEQQERIDELAREVRHLRETVARLRGGSMVPVPAVPSAS